MVAKPRPVVFRPRPPSAVVIWAAFAVLFSLAIVVVVLTWAGVLGRGHGGQPEVLLIGFIPGLIVALLARPQPLGLDRTGLHVGSDEHGYVVSWSNITGVVRVPRKRILPERIRIRLTDSSLAPGWWARRRWGMRVLLGGELELRLTYGQAGGEIADEIRRFIDGYG